MPCLHSRRCLPSLVAGLLAGGLLAVPAPAGVAAERGMTSAPGSSRPDQVRLSGGAGVVGSAEVPVERGTERLRTTSYSMVAATWRGRAPRVSIREPGSGEWQRLQALGDGPDATSEGEPGLQGTELLWTGPRRDLDVRVRGGGAQDVDLVLIDPGSLDSDDRQVATGGPRLARKRAERAPRPRLLTRKRWGADPDWRNGEPVYLNLAKQVHLHHTATGNQYRRSDVPAIIRGMYRYHTQTLGWFDIGYNFLVDKFGRTWVGRSGGPAKLVRGAHTLGFNNASVGVAVIGNHENRKPWRKVVPALVRIAAWKFDIYDRRARGGVWVKSTGSDKYDEGKRVRLPAFDGHRDTNDTACPGDRLYARLPALRRRTQRRIENFS